MQEGLTTGFLTFNILTTLIFVLLLIKKKSRTIADSFLIGILISLVIQSLLIILNIYFDTTNAINPVGITFLYGPLLYLYASKIISTTGVHKIDFVHFSPFIGAVILQFFDTTFILKMLSGAAVASGMTYISLTYWILQKHTKSITNHFSYIEKINLIWIQRLVKGLLLIWLIVTLLVTLNQAIGFDIQLNFFFCLIPFFVIYIGYHGIKQKVISISPAPEINYRSNTETKTSGYKKSGLQNANKKQIYDLLLQAMEEEKLYLRPTLSLQDLSDETNIPTHHITETLNRFAQKSFYDFVNGYRVNAFIEKLKTGNEENFSLLGIALDCGFNSKSSFNRIFKRITGFSPSEYRNTKL